MKIIFMGSAAFAVPSLMALAEAEHEIAEVVTQPDKPAGRGREITPCPIAAKARKMNLQLYQPKSVKKPEVISHFKERAPDLIAIVAYGKILPIELIEIPKFGCVNVHSSLLPKYRGAAPINWAIINGETETGVTTMRINEEMDAGEILLSCKTDIDDVEDAPMLHDRLAQMGSNLLVETISQIESGRIRPRNQDHTKATYAPMIRKEDGLIDWSMRAKDIYNRVRGFKPWPGAFTHLGGKSLRIHEAALTDLDFDAAPGEIIETDGALAVKCGSGVLYLIEVQLEGKKKMPAQDFLRGYKVKKGTILK
ncbi:MAG TPA: methionyl-tRNA formyltransferase [bacterium]|nr:methionyl-tRNA formyltransferase [Myxococcales bacterium]HPW44846.1 methionyl-tRNA formyltransferase [bacterium]HQC50520.1 methionyl-tRNA formyltransferase [bacterium]